MKFDLFFKDCIFVLLVYKESFSCRVQLSLADAYMSILPVNFLSASDVQNSGDKSTVYASLTYSSSD